MHLCYTSRLTDLVFSRGVKLDPEFISVQKLFSDEGRNRNTYRVLARVSVPSIQLL